MPLSGELEAATVDSLTLRVGNGQEMLARNDVMRVDEKRPGHRARNSFIGLGVGFGVGFGVGLGAGAAAGSGCTGYYCGLAAVILGTAGLIVGLATGALWPTGGWRKVYQK